MAGHIDESFLGYSVDEVAATLFMSPRTVQRRVGFLIMEAAFEHPDKTISADVWVLNGFEAAFK